MKQQNPNVQIRKDTYARLQEFIKRQTLPPKIVDVVSIAVDEFIKKQK